MNEEGIMQRPVFIILVGVLSALSFFASPNPGLAAAPTESGADVLVVGYIPIADCLQLYVAEAMGYFREEGITVRQQAMKGGTAIAPAVESGELQVGWSNVISIIIAHAKGFDFTILTTGAFEADGGHRTHSLLVPADSPVQKITELADKRIAINTLGNVNELSITALTDSLGMDPKKVRLVEVPFPDMEAALKNHSVDAALVTEPFVTLSLMHGTARTLDPAVHKVFGERFMIGSWFAKKSWIEKHPDQAARFARAVKRASEYISTHPKEVTKHLLDATKLSEELAAKITLPGFYPDCDIRDLQRVIDLTAKYQFIPKSFDAAEILSPFAR